MSKTVLILGAGVGGLTTADTLRQLLPPEDRIILVDRSFDGTLGLSLLYGCCGAGGGLTTSASAPPRRRCPVWKWLLQPSPTLTSRPR